MLRNDDDGNIIGCNECGSRSMRKDGWHYQSKKKHKQRWKCTACGKNTLYPKILEKAPFRAKERPIEFAPIEELIDHRNKLYNRKKQ